MFIHEVRKKMKVLEDYLMYFRSAEKKMFYNKWLRPASSAELRAGASLVHRSIEQSGVELWLLDATNCHTPCREDQMWLLAEMGKLFENSECRLRKLAMVRSNEVFFTVIAENMQERLNALYGESMTMRHFDNLAVAYDWLLAEERTAPLNTASLPTSVQNPFTEI